MKVWTTKYALTRGIQEIEADTFGEDTPKMVADRSQSYPTYYHGEGREWHRDKESAIRRAEAMRDTKIQSLQKQISKLEALDFRSTRVD